MVSKVFSLGGSVVQQNLDSIEKIADALERDEQIVVVTGAGELKKYIRAVDSNHARRDMIGIQATRLNAQTLLTAMDAHPSIPETPEEVLEAAATGNDVVMGGLVPGYSTDAVAATAAELLDAELYIATTVDGVYDADPENADAEKLDEVTPERLRELTRGNSGAGGYSLIDRTAVDIIERSEIRTKVFKGSLENLGCPEAAEGTNIIF